MKKQTLLCTGLLALLAACGQQTASTPQASTGGALRAQALLSVTNTDDDGPGSLRQAIKEANATAGADTITFGTTGTITLQSPLPTVTDALTISGPGATRLSISGNNAVRVLEVSGSTLAVNEVTITGGNAEDFGGGVKVVNGSTLTVTSSTFSGNSASAGGGIYADRDGVLTVVNSTFGGNRAGTTGGGINSEGTLRVKDSTFSGNEASAGGGIYSRGTLTVTNSTFSNNSTLSDNSPAYFGGGIANGGTLTVTNSTFSGNEAAVGGGIGSGGTLTVTVTNSTFSGNSAEFGGGGLLTSDETVTVTNSTFSGNSAGSIGGGMFIGKTATLTHSTLSGNSAPDGGGLFLSVLGAATLTNTTVAGSPAGGNCSRFVDVSDSTSGASGIPISDLGGNLSSDASCTFTAATSQNSVNPLLGSLADNGGPTRTLALLPGSPAIDAATCVVTTDQRGVTRPQGKACDSGAFELEQQNRAPTATTDSATVAEDSSATINVLSNDTDPDGDALTVVSVTRPIHGTVTISTDQKSVTYTPSANFNGIDSFTSTISDGRGGISSASVNIVVTPVNDAPTVTVSAGGQCRSDTSGLVNLAFADVDSAASSLTVTATSSNTTLVPIKNVTFTGTGATRTATITTVIGKTGTATLTLTASDGLASSTTTVTVQSGGNGNDTLTGTEGADLLFGQNGDDTLRSQGGNDVLCGGLGNDTFVGGAGADHNNGGSGTDRVLDFNAAEGDTWTNIP